MLFIFEFPLSVVIGKATEIIDGLFILKLGFYNYPFGNEDAITPTTNLHPIANLNRTFEFGRVDKPRNIDTVDPSIGVNPSNFNAIRPL
jgi:hypothetical protein